MPTKKLTAVVVPSLTPGEYWDKILPGLILRVGARRRTWQYRVRSGETYRRIPLGHFPAMELAEARESVRNLIERLEKGAPPLPSGAASALGRSVHAGRADRSL
jgi:hypothetical protein